MPLNRDMQCQVCALHSAAAADPVSGPLAGDGLLRCGGPSWVWMLRMHVFCVEEHAAELTLARLGSLPRSWSLGSLPRMDNLYPAAGADEDEVDALSGASEVLRASARGRRRRRHTCSAT